MMQAGMTIAETLEKQSEIIRLQSGIIDRLAAELLQSGHDSGSIAITDEDLGMIRKAALLQAELND